ncbi:MAG: thiamine phosphate synthase [Gemmatimonadota bacterium]
MKWAQPSEGLAASVNGHRLAEALRLLVLTDPECRHPGGVVEGVRAALDAGCRAVQLRHKSASANELYHMACRLGSLTRAAGALLFVNDRVDVALAAGADGVHLGPDDLPPRAIRHALPPGFLLGVSCDDPAQARLLVDQGADFVGCGTVYPTRSKADAGEAIGLEGLRAVVEAVSVPVVGIGGITADRYRDVLSTGAAGAAVLGAVMEAPHAGEAVRAFLEQG